MEQASVMTPHRGRQLRAAAGTQLMPLLSHTSSTLSLYLHKW